jgi:acetyl coenzyme A synthetase (ADP forming)-like protein
MTLAIPTFAAAGVVSGDVVLRDGSTVAVRAIGPQDEDALLALFRSLSTHSRALRFFTAAPNLPRWAHEEANLGEQEAGLVAVSGRHNRIVGHASYRMVGPGRAEVAFAVADDFQGRGLGTLLLACLADTAEQHGVHAFEADVLPENTDMIAVFRQAGFPVHLTPAPEGIHIAFPIRLTDEAIAKFDQREQIAASNAVHAFLYPRAVAVIGASRDRGTPSAEVFHNLLAGEFCGPIYPVNPRAPVVQSVAAYPSIAEVPGPVDLAVIAVPAAEVLDVAAQCAQKGVRALVVLSAGFAEIGEEGRARQAELLRLCRASGMRLLGPNCIGIANTDPSVRLNATFGPIPITRGHVGFSSQSGALGLAAIDSAAALGLGISSFFSVGNKADISGNDLLCYWESDPNTDVILLYLESFGNPRKFARIARRVGKTKPIIAVKSGRSSAGARATSSHTGALLAASDVTVDALFRQAGVIRTDTLQELFGVAQLLAHQPAPAGRRVAIVTNVGGPGILCADACEARGLEIPSLALETQQVLRQFLPAVASVGNPVDMIATANAENYRQAIAAVANDPNVDAIIAIFIPPLATRAEEVARAIMDAARSMPTAKTVLSVFMSSGGVPAELCDEDLRIPAYAFPEDAASALGHAARYGEWRSRPLPQPVHLDGLRRDDAARLIARALGRGGGWLDPSDVSKLLACYGLPLVEQRLARTSSEAGEAAAALGGDIVLKALLPGVIHKTDLGLVRLSLSGEGDVLRAAEAMSRQVPETQGGIAPTYLVQRYVPDGTEMIVGLVHDAQFGPVIACGAGGTVVELMKDVAVALTPLDREEATAMIHRLKTYPVLQGYRGSTPRDVAALEDILLHLSAMAEDLPQLAELDFNPVLVREHGAVIVDARIRIEAIPNALPPWVRR